MSMLITFIAYTMLIFTFLTCYDVDCQIADWQNYFYLFGGSFDAQKIDLNIFLWVDIVHFDFSFLHEKKGTTDVWSPLGYKHI